jgi:hypothetical protein
MVRGHILLHLTMFYPDKRKCLTNMRTPEATVGRAQIDLSRARTQEASTTELTTRTMETM